MHETNPFAASFIPTVTETTTKGERGWDIFSRLLRDRIIMLNGPIMNDTAALVTAQLLFLDYENPREDIKMYINSPGGMVTAGLAIYDTMKLISADVSTICMGMAASMGAFLLCGGTKGKRLILPNAEVMIHQPLGGARGQATDIEIAAKHILRTKARLNRLMAANTGQPLEKIAAETERDNYMDAEEAVAYGLVDGIVDKRPAPVETTR